MKNIIEVIKTNKGIILKGLAALGAVAGITLASTKLIGKGTKMDDCGSDEMEMADNE